MVMFFDFVFFLLFKFALGGSDNIILDVNFFASRLKFIVRRHQFMGLTYYSYQTMPGQYICKIYNKDNLLFEAPPEGQKIQFVYCFYYEKENWYPTFLVKSGSGPGRTSPLDDCSPEDSENHALIKALFTEIKRTYHDDKEIQKKLANISTGVTDFDENIVSRLTFRVINDSNYLERKKGGKRSLIERKKQLGEDDYPFDKNKIEEDVVSTHTIEEELETTAEELYADESLDDSEEFIQPPPTQTAQQLEEPQLEPEIIVITDSEESDDEIEGSGQPSESEDQEPPDKKKKEEEETVTVELDSEEEDT
ncbi:hypothetical protein TpMuguga_03g00581 [Theileria parva strain Muguga]|uniref:Tash1 protein n=1 Tax=Theileria parva TaxID=5875 RepID=Q4MZB3_THEPA|nr:uncharacterized protein TpMuguga_03g00581 [Theileria parva strain Muguga]EAN31326.1 hypothetical protein TpMuguga_03g00581 [Theileria parva strain Muguga]|eukprot:XP_763609.1 hypothetical protein [Theileria parva strain Muguga]